MAPALDAGSSSSRRKLPLPSQKELFLACLRPGSHADLVLKRDDDEETVEARGSMVHDLTRDRKLILAQTSPPLSRSYLGKLIEITFLCRFDDIPGGRLLRVGYTARLLDIISDYHLSPTLIEPVLVVDVPPRLDETSLRMHFRVVPPLEYGLKGFIGAATLRKVIDAEASQFDHQVRRQLWDRQRHPKLVLRDLTEALRVMVDNVNKMVEEVRQAEVADISEGGTRLVHPRTWEMVPDSRIDLTLVWGDETLDVEAEVVRGGDVESSRGSAPKAYTCLRFVAPGPETRRRLSKLLNEILRKELAKRSGLDD